MNIDRAWRNYAKLVVPQRASWQQRHQLRLAFYAGFISMFATAEEIGDRRNKEDDSLRLLESLRLEIIDFNKEIKERMENGNF